MGKIAAGMLLMLVGMLLYGPGAQAAEIPPTKQCVNTFAKQFGKLVRQGGLDGTKAVKDRVGDRFAENLAKAGCVSDAEPLKDWVAPKPFSEQCIEASRAADAFWKPVSRKVKQLTIRFKARTKQTKARARNIGQRIRQLRQAGASKRRINALERRWVRQLFKSIRITFKYLENTFEAVEPKADATTLTMLELVSLRCIGGKTFNSVLDDEEKPSEPFARVLWRHRLMVSLSLLDSVLSSASGSSSATASSGSNNAFKAIEEGYLTLDHEVLRGGRGNPFDAINFRNLDLLP